MKQRAKKTKKERKREKEGTKKKAKKKDNKQERKKRKRERERDRKRNLTSGRPKRLRRNRGRHSKINQKCPFLGGKQVFSIRSNEGKEKKKNQKTNKQTKTNKEGLGPSEVALQATSPDP